MTQLRRDIRDLVTKSQVDVVLSLDSLKAS